MARVRLRHGHKKEIEVSGILLPDTVVRAELIVKAAQALAPRRFDNYARKIKVAIRGTNEVRVEATDFKSNWIEFGTHPRPPYRPYHGRNPMRAYAPLRRGALMVGLRPRGGKHA